MTANTSYFPLTWTIQLFTKKNVCLNVKDFLLGKKKVSVFFWECYSDHHRRTWPNTIPSLNVYKSLCIFVFIFVCLCFFFSMTCKKKDWFTVKPEFLNLTYKVLDNLNQKFWRHTEINIAQNRAWKKGRRDRNNSFLWCVLIQKACISHTDINVCSWGQINFNVLSKLSLWEK